MLSSQTYHLSYLVWPLPDRTHHNIHYHQPTILQSETTAYSIPFGKQVFKYASIHPYNGTLQRYALRGQLHPQRGALRHHPGQVLNGNCHYKSCWWLTKNQNLFIQNLKSLLGPYSKLASSSWFTTIRINPWFLCWVLVRRGSHSVSLRRGSGGWFHFGGLGASRRWFSNSSQESPFWDLADSEIYIVW